MIKHNILGVPTIGDDSLVINPIMFRSTVNVSHDLIPRDVCKDIGIDQIYVLRPNETDVPNYVFDVVEKVEEEIMGILTDEKLDNISIEEYRAHLKHYLIIQEEILAKIKGELGTLFIVQTAIKKVVERFGNIKDKIEAKKRREFIKKAQVLIDKLLSNLSKEDIKYAKSDEVDSHNPFISQIEAHILQQENIRDDEWKIRISTIVKPEDLLEGISDIKLWLSIISEIYEIPDSKDIKNRGKYFVVTILTPGTIYNHWDGIIDTNGKLPFLCSWNSKADYCRHVKSRINMLYPDDISEIKEKEAIKEFDLNCINKNSNSSNTIYIRIITRCKTIEDARIYSEKSKGYLMQCGGEILSNPEFNLNPNPEWRGES